MVLNHHQDLNQLTKLMCYLVANYRFVKLTNQMKEQQDNLPLHFDYLIMVKLDKVFVTICTRNTRGGHIAKGKEIKMRSIPKREFYNKEILDTD